jgi:hypothetical protein
LPFIRISSIPCPLPGIPTTKKKNHHSMREVGQDVLHLCIFEDAVGISKAVSVGIGSEQEREHREMFLLAAKVSSAARTGEQSN